MLQIRSIFLFVFLWLIQACQLNETLKNALQPPVNLRSEYCLNPVGVYSHHPLFTWQLQNKSFAGKLQSIQVIVSSSIEGANSENGDIWDSGEIPAGREPGLIYKGPDLKSSTKYYWRVRYLDSAGNTSPYSNASWFETGIAGEEGWKAKWIRTDRPAPIKDEDFYKDIPAPMFRKDFKLTGEVKNARLYISGLGYFEAFLNGKKIGKDVLHPGWTQYAKRVLYSTYDVTRLLNEGENTMGVLLGNGWYNPLPLRLFGKYNLREFLTKGRLKFIAQLLITYKGGRSAILTSDESWRWKEGPLLKNNVYLGEVYDARRELPGWNKPGYDDSDWGEAVVAASPGGILKEQFVPPNRITRVIEPVAMTSPVKGVYVFDMGQNFAGWINFKMHGKPGQRVTMRYGELLFDNGRVNGFTTVAGQIKEQWHMDGGPGSPKTAWQEDTYIMKGDGEETFQHHFTFRGFRYVEVRGLKKEPEKSDIKGLRINSDLSLAGTFSCSNPLFNKIQQLVDWTFLSNVFSVESDCPAREKFGYGGDIVAAGEAYLFNFDMANFYKKAVRDFQLDARPNGGLTECAPYNGIDSEGFGAGTGPVGWQLAHPFMLKKLYQYYGDKAFVEEQYPTVVRLAEFLKTQETDHLIFHGIGDHESLDPKPTEITSSAFYYHIIGLTAGLAGILDKTEDQQKYGALAEEIKKAFIDRYYKGEGRVGDHPTQATQVFALYYGLLPEGEEAAVLRVLEKEILLTHKGHLSTGIFGTKMMFDVLVKYGRNDLAYTMVNQKDFPGYGYMIENGATTLWEHWKLDKNTFSHNHPMFGSVSEWFYKGLGGIQPAKDAVGFDRIIIRPHIAANLQWVRCSYRSVRGLVVSNWKTEKKILEMEVEIPAGARAMIYVPVDDPDNAAINVSGQLVYRNGKPVDGAELKWVRTRKRAVIFTAKGGRYHILAD